MNVLAFLDHCHQLLADGSHQHGLKLTTTELLYG